MSYPDLSSADDATWQDLLARKEMFQLRPDPDRQYRVGDGRDLLARNFLKIHSTQLFVREFQNPNTLFKRLHVSHMTGTGKTLAAVATAQEFIKSYRQIYAGLTVSLPPSRRNQAELDRRTPSVFVLGFAGTKGAFMRELLRYPEFGFITAFERAEFTRREAAASLGLVDDIKLAADYKAMLKKRLTNRNRGGFYRFFGYDEFVNRLFLSETIKLTDLEAEVSKENGARTLEEVIGAHIKSGAIRVNEAMLEMFEDSLIIADEIHNTYNMNMKNNRGVALQYVLDTILSVRFLSLSATPINNLPTESVEFLNYLLPPEQKIARRDIFIGRRTPKPGGIARLGALSRGRISFLQDINEEYFPRREFIGETITLAASVGDMPAGSAVPYLKFIECPMSQLHADTLRHMLSSAEISQDVPDDDDEILPTDLADAADPSLPSARKIPTDGYAIYDMVYPNPASEVLGLYRSVDVRTKISPAPQEWRDAKGIDVRKSVATGSFLTREKIGKYSTKARTLLDVIAEIMGGFKADPAECGKIMIYHERVRTSGVVFYAELLRANGFADEHSEPVDSTLCCVCAHTMEGHGSAHEYMPARFVVAHSDIDRTTMDRSLAKYNALDNTRGHKYLILLGSRIIKESYDFKAVRHMVINSLPTNIPTFIQVLGRAVRKGSHADLPLAHRHVSVRILISTWGASKYGFSDTGLPPPTDPVAPEVRRYADKLAYYMVIQEIEREFNRNAIDADANRDIIMPPKLLEEYFPDGQTGSTPPRSMIGNLYFDPAVKLPAGTAPTDVTFRAYRHYEGEIKTISYLIKRLFLDEPVWTYDDLLARIRRPPIGLEVNPATFDERNFIIALHNLVERAHTIVPAKASNMITEQHMIESLFDPAERFIFRDGIRHKIEQIDRYYILFPVADREANPLNAVYAEYTEHTRDKERAMIAERVEPTGRVSIDAETFSRRPRVSTSVSINIGEYISANRAAMNYESLRNTFVMRADDLTEGDLLIAFLFDSSARFQVSFVEDAVKWLLGTKFTPTTGDAATFETVFERIVAILEKFRVMIYAPEIIKYKDTASQYKSGVPNAGRAPLGYQASKTVRLFDPEVERWLEVSKVSLNRHTSFKEVDPIVGYLESDADSMKFKLRNPAQMIKAARGTTQDTRTIERGIVCGTKTKYDLLKIIAALGISPSKLDHKDNRVRRLCEIIRDRLVELEIKERGRDSRYKYIYSWWDEMVDLAA